MRDRLFLLDNQFTDAEFPGRTFYCKDCIALNGLIAAFPEAAARLDIIRTKHARPRSAVVDLIGDDNQWLPVLVLADDAPADLATETFGGTRFINDFGRLLQVLHVRHGFPEPHP